jgi:glycosyltransferase involved in cell wall biosynthesis
MKPVIAHLLPHYNPFPPVFPAGTELRVENVARRQSHFSPLVVCAGFEKQPVREKIDAMQIERIHIGRAYRRVFQKITRLDPWPYFTRMRQIVAREKSVLIHIHNEPKILDALGPWIAARKLPLVVHVANDKPLPRMNLEAMRAVNMWVAASRFMADWLTQENGIEPARVRVVHTGVDMTAAPAHWQAATRAPLRAQHGIGESEIVFGFGGRLVKEKGVFELIDAFKLLRASSTVPVRLLVAGNVRDSDDPENEKAVYGREAVRRMAETPGINYAGSLHPNQMHAFLSACDVFMLPSIWHDPFPTVMIEAAAAGLPMIAAARGGITEFLEGCPGFTFLYDPQNADEIAAKMQALAGDARTRRSQGEWLRTKIEAHYDWSRVTSDLESLYAELLA